jgi:hypothetical protein
MKRWCSQAKAEGKDHADSSDSSSSNRETDDDMDEAEEAAVWDEYEGVVLGDEGDGKEGEEKDGEGPSAEDRRLIKEVRRRRIGMICGLGMQHVHTHWNVYVCVLLMRGGTDLAI